VSAIESDWLERANIREKSNFHGKNLNSTRLPWSVLIGNFREGLRYPKKSCSEEREFRPSGLESAGRCQSGVQFVSAREAWDLSEINKLKIGVPLASSREAQKP
jgi:hypothetical protein